jgi:hypothetical protein
VPFDGCAPRPFNTKSVHTYVPCRSGVYGVSNAREWIYIGETDNLQRALAGHLQESDTTLMSRNPTGFVFEECDALARVKRQDRLVFEYEPYCNRRWVKGRS